MCLCQAFEFDWDGGGKIQVHTSLSPVTETAIKRRIYSSVTHVTHSATAGAAQVFCPLRKAANPFPLLHLVNQITAVLKGYFKSKLFSFYFLCLLWLK